MLQVTFYSYKGGVGRTLALLNVGALLARHFKVVAIDFDLEAPGFGLSSFTKRNDPESRGISNLLMDWQEGLDTEVTDPAFSSEMPGYDGRFRLFPAGSRARELSRLLPTFYENPESDLALVFERLSLAIEKAYQPDFLLIDSRTGRSDIAGVSLLELADVRVMFCGLNEQNVEGMSATLKEVLEHPAAREDTATLLELSPVPPPERFGMTMEDLHKETRYGLFEAFERRTADGEEFRKALTRAGTVAPSGSAEMATVNSREEPQTGSAGNTERPTREGGELRKALNRVGSVLGPLLLGSWTNARKHFPVLERMDLIGALPYDPLVPLTEELQVTRAGSPLVPEYDRLASLLDRLRRRNA